MIEVNGLSKQFKNETAITYKDIIFETGKSYMLLGASGCGKSTLLNMIAGIMSPSSGKITIDGNCISEDKQKQKDAYRIQKIGYIYQDFKLMPEMTVADNINILRMEGIDTSSLNDWLKRFGIAGKKKKKTKFLSGGEKQRVAIIRALIKQPDIILADEPTGNLNYTIGEQVVRELIEAAKGKTLIVVTHDNRLAHFFDCVIDVNDLTGTKEG